MKHDIKAMEVEKKRNSEEFKENGSGRPEGELEKELKFYRTRSSELEEKNREAEDRCRVLLMEVEHKRKDHETLKDKFSELELRKLDVEDRLREHMRSYDDIKERLTRLEEDYKVSCEREKSARERNINLSEELKKMEQDTKEKHLQLKMENMALESAKRRAENEIEIWKKNFREVELRVSRLEEVDSSLRSEEAGADYDKEDLSNVIKIQDEENAGISNSHLVNPQTQERELNDDGTIKSFGNEGSICFSPVEENEHVQVRGSPSINMRLKSLVNDQEEKKSISLETEVQYGTRVRKQLVFEREENNKKTPPSMLSNVIPRLIPASGDVIEISESDDEMGAATLPTSNIRNSRVTATSVDCSLRILNNEREKKCLMKETSDKRTGENESSSEENFPFTLAPKRKRASNIVTSESEGDDDDEDKIPIAKLKMMKHQELGCEPLDSPTSGVVNPEESLTPLRRRIVTLRQCEEKKGGVERTSLNKLANCGPKYQNQIFVTADNVEEDEMETGSDNESESLSGFIVNSSDDSERKNDSSDSEDSTDGEAFYQILSRIRRNKNNKSGWEYEADMLSSFEKDSELCLKAVCALYRQQTSEEKSAKGSLYYNNRGFNKFDALRGTTLAEFLTDGDPRGDLKKSVEELERFDPRALEECKRLAAKYSKQLFNIYQNKEDPLFLPS
ncbi:PREDICTED: uncharacterized protein LOC104600314 isoform X2 [Nelumbo nucifera]|uniref:Uncharacterized protein LOC104600314 isoform X2 n=1 Tax=Nelumbo nucifera TaxID=4432 RepID=A0A1U8A360_NELNU|nr:PREDICTED: uncharacterized protein LOC104600314 isoform X2 [Nelumbo nucifera]